MTFADLNAYTNGIFEKLDLLKTQDLIKIEK